MSHPPTKPVRRWRRRCSRSASAAARATSGSSSLLAAVRAGRRIPGQRAEAAQRLRRLAGARTCPCPSGPGPGRAGPRASRARARPGLLAAARRVATSLSERAAPSAGHRRLRLRAEAPQGLGRLGAHEGIAVLEARPPAAPPPGRSRSCPGPRRCASGRRRPGRSGPRSGGARPARLPRPGCRGPRRPSIACRRCARPGPASATRPRATDPRAGVRATAEARAQPRKELTSSGSGSAGRRSGADRRVGTVVRSAGGPCGPAPSAPLGAAAAPCGRVAGGRRRVAGRRPGVRAPCATVRRHRRPSREGAKAKPSSSAGGLRISQTATDAREHEGRHAAEADGDGEAGRGERAAARSGAAGAAGGVVARGRAGDAGAPVRAGRVGAVAAGPRGGATAVAVRASACGHLLGQLEGGQALGGRGPREGPPRAPPRRPRPWPSGPRASWPAPSGPRASSAP